MRDIAVVTGGAGFIGRHLAAFLSGKNLDVLSIDRRPQQSSSLPYKDIQLDLSDALLVRNFFKGIRPRFVFHLAARTDTDSNRLGEYEINWKGTENMLRAVEGDLDVRFIHISTQMVARPGLDVSNPLSFEPFTAYGESKVRSELLVREMRDRSSWAIVRPTNIWGPGHPRHGTEILHFIQKSFYFEPSGRSAVRAYGFVANFVEQLYELATSKYGLSRGEVWYGGDANIQVAEWSDALSMAITGHPVRRLPRFLVRGAGVAGEAALRAGLPSPFYWNRYKNMVRDYRVPVEKTVKLVGRPRYPLAEAAALTANELIAP